MVLGVIEYMVAYFCKLPSILFLVFSMLVSTSCFGGEYLITDEIDKANLELHGIDGRCAIKLNDISPLTVLDIPSPCGFVKKFARKNAQKYFYNNVGLVYIIAGPLSGSNSYKKNNSVNINHRCSDIGQAVIISGENITLRPSKKIPLGFCHNLGFDKKVFYGYAYPVN